MAGRGPAPKDVHQRARDTRRRQADAVTITPDDEVRGPELPPGYTPDVVNWYNTWRRSPQAQLFEATDWQRLLVLAPMVQRYFEQPTASALSEIRLNEERLGATVVDRQRAKVKIRRESENIVHGPPTVAAHGSARASVAARLRGGAR